MIKNKYISSRYVTKYNVQLLSNVIQLTLSQNKPILTQLIFDHHHTIITIIIIILHIPIQSAEPNFILINFIPFLPIFHYQFRNEISKSINPRIEPTLKIIPSIESSTPSKSLVSPQLTRSKDVCERMWSKDKILVRSVPKRIKYSWRGIRQARTYTSAGIASEICPYASPDTLQEQCITTTHPHGLPVSPFPHGFAVLSEQPIVVAQFPRNNPLITHPPVSGYHDEITGGFLPAGKDWGRNLNFRGRKYVGARIFRFYKLELIVIN